MTDLARFDVLYKSKARRMDSRVALDLELTSDEVLGSMEGYWFFRCLLFENRD